MSDQKCKELVTLREKPMQNGGKSLFLDYTLNGLRRKEYLKMYLVPETSKIAKLQNAETLKAAKVIQAQRTIELQNGEAGIKPKFKDVMFFDFIEGQKKAYMDHGKKEYSFTIGKILTWLKRYGGDKPLRQIDKEYLLGFYDFCRKGLSEKEKKALQEKYKSDKRGHRKTSGSGLSDGTIYTYHSVFGTLFNNAIKNRLIMTNPIMDMEASERPQRPETERQYLTLDEVKKLMATKILNDEVRNAFLFSCFTGLRLGDIEDLTWSMIRETGSGREVATRQNKTRRYVYVPLSENAEQFLPKYHRGEKVWHLTCRDQINKSIQRRLS